MGTVLEMPRFLLAAAAAALLSGCAGTKGQAAAAAPPAPEEPEDRSIRAAAVPEGVLSREVAVRERALAARLRAAGFEEAAEAHEGLARRMAPPMAAEGPSPAEDPSPPRPLSLSSFAMRHSSFDSPTPLPPRPLDPSTPSYSFPLRLLFLAVLLPLSVFLVRPGGPARRPAFALALLAWLLAGVFLVRPPLVPKTPFGLQASGICAALGLFAGLLATLAAKRRWRALAASAILSGLAAGGGLTAAGLAVGPEDLAETLREAAGGAIRMDRARILGPASLEGEGFVAQIPGEGLRLRAPRVEVSFGVADLLDGDPRIERIVLHEPRLEYEAATADRPGAERGTPAARPPTKVLDGAVVSVRGGSFSARLPGEEAPLEGEGVDGEFRVAGEGIAGARFRVERVQWGGDEAFGALFAGGGTARAAAFDLEVKRVITGLGGPVGRRAGGGRGEGPEGSLRGSLRGRVSWDGRRLIPELAASIADGELRLARLPVTLSRLNADLDLSPGRIEVRRFSAEGGFSAGQRWSGAGGTEGGTFRLTAVSEELRVDGLLLDHLRRLRRIADPGAPFLPGWELEGVCDLTLELSAPPGGEPSFDIEIHPRGMTVRIPGIRAPFTETLGTIHADPHGFRAQVASARLAGGAVWGYYQGAHAHSGAVGWFAFDGADLAETFGLPEKDGVRPSGKLRGALALHDQDTGADRFAEGIVRISEGMGLVALPPLEPFPLPRAERPEAEGAVLFAIRKNRVEIRSALIREGGRAIAARGEIGFDSTLRLAVRGHYEVPLVGGVPLLGAAIQAVARAAQETFLDVEVRGTLADPQPAYRPFGNVREEVGWGNESKRE